MHRALLALLGLVLLAAPAAAQAPCPDDFEAATAPLTCACSAEAAADGAVWGSGIYTTDSRVCRAALHAGAIPPGGGIIAVTPAPGRQAYEASTANGVTTAAYGPWRASFLVAAQGTTGACPTTFEHRTAPLTCSCTAEAGQSGTVWGSGPYTADSRICRAAIHAGVIPPSGGEVTARPAPGQSAYRGSTANGVTTTDYGAWDASFTLAAETGGTKGAAGGATGGATPAAVAAGPIAACPATFEGRTADLSCICGAAAALTGMVWGTGIYTADSQICRAALHAGVIGPDGGRVSIVALAGQDVYFGSAANGVSTSRWGVHGASFSFRR